MMVAAFLIMRDGVGVLIGAFFVFVVIWECWRLGIWAESEGYDLLSVNSSIFFRYCHVLPSRSCAFRALLRGSDGSLLQAVIAFAPFDFLLKNPILLESDDWLDE